MGKYVRLLQFSNHIVFPSLFIFYFDIVFFVFGVLLCFLISGYGVSVGFHRLFAHQSLKTSEFMEWLLLFLGTIATLGSSIAWVGAHRHHHAHSDNKKDIHSPVIFGKLKIRFGFWPKTIINLKYVKSLLREKKHRLFHKYYFAILFLYIAVLLSLFGLKGTIYFYCLPALFCFHAASAVNVFGHNNTSINTVTKDFSKNLLWLSFLASGESYHLNHHRFPRECRFGKWDLGYFFASLIKS